MSTPLDDHIRCRTKVCVVCYRKSSRIVSERDIKTIQTYLIDGYTKDNINFPSGLCNGYHLLLVKKSVDENTVLPLLYSYDPERPTLLRSDLVCPCKICKVCKKYAKYSIVRKENSWASRSSSTPYGYKKCGRVLQVLLKNRKRLLSQLFKTWKGLKCAKSFG